MSLNLPGSFPILPVRPPSAYVDRLVLCILRAFGLNLISVLLLQSFIGKITCSIQNVQVQGQDH